MRILLIYSLIMFAPFFVRAEQVPDSIPQSLQKSKEFAYANDPSYWTTEKPSTANTGLEKFIRFLATSPAIKWVGYIILAVIILLIIYQVAVINNFFVFSRSKRKRKQQSGDQEELTVLDIDEKIRESVAIAEYRMAIRYLYLKTLNVLHEKNVISLHARATNNDYLQQMRSSSGHREFASLTGIYEYVWYGEFQPGRQQFEKIQTNFNQFISGY